jgi:hypothetical protein
MVLNTTEGQYFSTVFAIIWAGYIKYVYNYPKISYKIHQKYDILAMVTYSYGNAMHNIKKTILTTTNTAL